MTNENNFITLTCVNNNGSHCSNLFLGTDANGNNHTITISLDVDKLVEEKGVGIAEMHGATLTLRGDVIGQLQSCTAQYSTGEQSAVEYVAENGEVTLPIDLYPLLFAEAPTITLTNSNALGGLQITDTSVNVTKTDRKAAYRILTPIKPIPGGTAKIVTVKNDTNTIVQTKRCDSEHTVYVEFDYKRKPDKKALRRLMLKLKLTGESLGSLYVFNASNTGTEENPHYTRETAYGSTTVAQQIIEDDNVYILLDITNKLPTATGVLALVANNNAYATFSGSVSFVEDVVPYVDIMEESAVLQKELGEKTKYEVNLLNGRLFATTHLYSATGNLLPANLSMAYNEAYSDSLTVHGMPLFAKGWKLNYQQCVVFNDDNTCTYVDENFKERTFKLAENSTNVYYDFDGKSGTRIYKNIDGSSTLSINTTNMLFFDNTGKLTSIYQAKNTFAVYTHIEYDQEGLPSVIYDGMGNNISFERRYNEVYVKCNDLEVARMAIRTEKELLGTTLFCQAATVFSYDDSKLAQLTELHDKKKVLFTYDTANSVSQIKTYGFCDKKQQTLMYTQFFEYKALDTTVLVSQVSEQKDAFCFKTHYLFAENGDFLYKVDSNDDAMFSPVAYKSKDSYNNDMCIVNNCSQLKFAEQPIATISNSNGQNTQRTVVATGDCTTNSRKSLVIGVQARVNSPTSTEDNSKLQLKVTVRNKTKNQVTIKTTTPFDVSQYKWQAVSIKIDNLVATSEYAVSAEIISTNFNSKVYVRNAYVAPYNGLITSDIIRTTNTITPAAIKAGTKYTEHTENETVDWYGMSNVTLKIDDTTIENVKFTHKDYLLTQRSRFDGSGFAVFYNDGASLYENARELKFVYGIAKISFEKIKMATLQYNEALSFIKAAFDSNGYTQTITNNVGNEDNTHITDTTEEYSYADVLTRKIDEDGIITQYSYDAWGNCTEEKMMSKDQSLNIVSRSDYGSNGKYLKSQTLYREGEELKREYVYNNKGLVAKQIYPNGQIEEYSYNSQQRLNKLNSTVDGVANSNQFSYSNNLIYSISHNGTTYAFDYDNYGNVCEVSIGNAFQWNKETILNGDGTTHKTFSYGNGQSLKKYYDKFGRVVTEAKLIEDNESVVCHYLYSDKEIGETIMSPTNPALQISANSKLRRVVDLENNIVYNYTYDDKGNVVDFTQIDKDADNNVLNTFAATVVEKDSLGKATAVQYKVNGSLVQQKRVNKENPLKTNVDSESTEYGDHLSLTTTHTRDALNRLSTIKKIGSNYKNGYQTSFTYANRVQGGNIVGTTPYVSNVKTEIIANNAVSTFRNEMVEYDKNGNIIQYGNTTYEYDKLNRLVRENNPDLERTFTWQYDAGGNITCRKEYSYTTDELGEALVEKPYTYGTTWKDQLVSFDGNSITYDQAGNPLSYQGNTFEWSRGRLLTKATLSNGKVVNMTYYANGLRASKQVGNATHKYYYDSDGNILQIATHYASGNTISMVFTYDSTGVTGFVADGNYYYFVKNFFGDVTDLYCGTAHIAHYTYDAWGNHTVTDQYGAAISDQYAWANVNPFRYRGYYYDVDLDLYLLQSRYYDSRTGRFINSDTLEYLEPKNINGLNLYSYCKNNPVMFLDHTGHVITLATLLLVALIGAVVGAIVGAGVGAVKAKANGDDVATAVISGIISGAIMGAGAAIAGVYLAAAATGAVLISSVLTATEASIMAGITAATSGFIGNALGEIAYQKRKYGEIKDANAILEKAFIGAINNTVAVFFWRHAETLTAIQFITSASLGNIFSGFFEFVSDTLKNLGE